jgi:hypothetical protein
MMTSASPATSTMTVTEATG